jgi:general secretion pathway protein G
MNQALEFRAPATRRTTEGFTLVEMLLVVIIASILASLVIPQLQRAREKAMIAAAIGDVDALGWNITEYELDTGALPEDLAAVGWGDKEDPWGNPYIYTKIRGGSPGKGSLRKDHFLVPINSDFDLYSMGPDGSSASPLTAKSSQDDIIRANDGGYVGIAAGY